MDAASRRSQKSERLLGELEQAHGRTSLPAMSSARPALHDLLLRLRLGEEPVEGNRER